MQLNEIKSVGNMEEAKFLICYKDKVWFLNNDSDMEELFSMFDQVDAGDVYSFVGEVNDYYKDVIVGHFDSETKTLTVDGIERNSPRTNKQFKKLYDEYGIMVDFNGMNNDDDDEVVGVRPFDMKGDLPTKLYHGTSSKYIHKILKQGLIGKEENSNWKELVSHDGVVFGAASYETAIFHANRTAGYEDAESFHYHIYPDMDFPIIIEFEVPDQSKLTKDWDIEREELDWKIADVFGYKGRIPASKITKLHCRFFDGVLIPNYNASLDPQDYDKELEKETSLYFGDYEDEEDYEESVNDEALTESIQRFKDLCGL